MKLDEFIQRFEALSDEAFLANFTHPFLLEAGQLLDTGRLKDDREVFLLRTRAGRSLVVGRGSTCDVRVALNEVSSQHAALVPPSIDDQPWKLLDTQSTNGTFVNGEKLTPGKPEVVDDCTAVRFGPDARFTFFHSSSFLRVFRKLTSEIDVDPAEADMLGKGTDPALRAQLSDSGQHQHYEESGLLLLCDPFDPIPLEPGVKVIVGRSPKTAMMVLPHNNVSRRHAEITCNDDGVVFIRDMGSANGTFIGKTRVGEQPMELLTGKKVSIGPYTLILEGPQEKLTRTTIVPTVPRKTPDVEGQLRDTSVLDLFNEIEIGQLTGSIFLTKGRFKANLTFLNGEPIDATTSKGHEGQDALDQIMALTEGTYLIRTDEEAPVVPRRITRSFSELALDSFLADETDDDD